MLLHRRHASLSSGKSARSRCGSLKESTNARPASVICRVKTPVFWILKSPGAGLPPAVIPLNGSASSASPVSTYFWSCGGSSACRARADTGVRWRTLRPGGSAPGSASRDRLSSAGAERGAHRRQDLAGDPGHEAALGVVRRRRVRDRVQAHVVEGRRRRLQHGEQLLHDLRRPAAQTERIGGGVGQEIDDLAAGFQIGRVVKVGEDAALALELLGIRPRPRQARRRRRASASIRSSPPPSTCPS